MKYVPFSDVQQSDDVKTAEEFYDEFNGKFPDDGILMYVEEVVCMDTGYRLVCSFCSCFCSYRFKSIAKVLKKYIGMAQKVDQKALVVHMKKTKSKSGYVQWDIGRDDGSLIKATKIDAEDPENINDFTTYLFRTKVSQYKEPNRLPDPHNKQLAVS